MLEPPDSFVITVDGDEVSVRPGQTIAAALIASGRVAWRRTRFDDRPRGLFCGIGVCFDCVVTVNGCGSVRACLAVAQPGDAVVCGD
jgi:predicted molibdopterin-dependent oxidoreductase YjgC